MPEGAEALGTVWVEFSAPFGNSFPASSVAMMHEALRVYLLIKYSFRVREKKHR